jgi:tetratricopeptide (TPR) repeat protein
MRYKAMSSLLDRAERLFLSGKYTEALRNYGLLLKDYPELEAAKVGVLLSDLGLEREEEAQALFIYYQVIQKEHDNAMEIIEGLLDSLDNSLEQIQKLVLNPLQEQVEYGDGISYNDFLQLVERKGSFKETFQDIMFSTRVVITNKDEFIDFVTQLSKEGFEEMALKYLDGTVHLFGNDQEVLELYTMVKDYRG